MPISNTKKLVKCTESRVKLCGLTKKKSKKVWRYKLYKSKVNFSATGKDTFQLKVCRYICKNL